MFAYADDIVLLAYAWAALKVLSCETVDVVKILDWLLMLKNLTVWLLILMIRKRLSPPPSHSLSSMVKCMQFVSEFRYLGHIITDNLRDDADIKREICNMYMRTC